MSNFVKWHSVFVYRVYSFRTFQHSINSIGIVFRNDMLYAILFYVSFKTKWETFIRKRQRDDIRRMSA